MIENNRVDKERIQKATDRLKLFYNKNCPSVGYGHPYESQYWAGGWYINYDLFEEDKKIAILNFLKNPNIIENV